jgi:hypothetical protein
MRNGAAGDGVVRDFVQYLQAGLDFPSDQVSHEVDRLFNLDCLTIGEAGGRRTVIWA